MTTRTDSPLPPPSTLRRRLLAVAPALLLGPARALAAPASGRTQVEVWKGPACGCCGDWIRHLQANGFEVSTHDDGNSDARESLGLPVRYGSCHTGRVEGYVVEGHVPAADIRRLLKERPRAIGLAVPGMPVGSPGMDGPQYGTRRDPYEVLLVLRDGSHRAWQTYR